MLHRIAPLICFAALALLAVAAVQPAVGANYVSVVGLTSRYAYLEGSQWTVYMRTSTSVQSATTIDFSCSDSIHNAQAHSFLIPQGQTQSDSWMFTFDSRSSTDAPALKYTCTLSVASGDQVTLPLGGSMVLHTGTVAFADFGLAQFYSNQTQTTVQSGAASGITLQARMEAITEDNNGAKCLVVGISCVDDRQVAVGTTTLRTCGGGTDGVSEGFSAKMDSTARSYDSVVTCTASYQSDGAAPWKALKPATTTFKYLGTGSASSATGPSNNPSMPDSVVDSSTSVASPSSAPATAQAVNVAMKFQTDMAVSDITTDFKTQVTDGICNALQIDTSRCIWIGASAGSLIVTTRINPPPATTQGSNAQVSATVAAQQLSTMVSKSDSTLYQNNFFVSQKLDSTSGVQQTEVTVNKCSDNTYSDSCPSVSGATTIAPSVMALIFMAVLASIIA